MDYTTNYHLPQWAEEDRILMEDFNEAMANLESGITEAKTAATTAQTTAEQLPYVVGTYTGTGLLAQNYITVGFRPRFVLISSQGSSSTQNLEPVLRLAILTDTCMSASFGKLTDTGFWVRTESSFPCPGVNVANTDYTYVAFP